MVYGGDSMIGGGYYMEGGLKAYNKKGAESMHAIVAASSESVFLGHFLHIGLLYLLLFLVLLRLAVLVGNHGETFLPSNAELHVFVAEGFQCLAGKGEVHHLLYGQKRHHEMHQALR